MAERYERYEGFLDYYQGEADAVGISWVLTNRDLQARPLDKIKLIEKDDYLIIYGSNGSVIWQGDIVPCHEPDWDGWIQAGFEPISWRALFFSGKGRPQLAATLFKKQREEKQDG